MNPSTHGMQGSASAPVLYMALELSNKTWRLVFSERDQGITKAGSRRVRTMIVHIAWLWLRFQLKSALSQWYQTRFAGAGARMRRIGIVAPARRLLIALWRYRQDVMIPEGAQLIPATL